MFLATCNCASYPLCHMYILRLAECADGELHVFNRHILLPHPPKLHNCHESGQCRTTSTFLFCSCCHFTECKICVVHEVLAHCHGVRSFTGYGEDVSVIRKLRTCHNQIGLNCQASRTVLVTQMQNSVRPPRGSNVFFPPSRRESQQKGEVP